MNVHVLLNLFTELRNRDKTQGFAEHFITFCNKFAAFNNYHMTQNVLSLRTRLLWPGNATITDHSQSHYDHEETETESHKTARAKLKHCNQLFHAQRDDID